MKNKEYLKHSISFKLLLGHLKEALSGNIEIQNVVFEANSILEEVLCLAKEDVVKYFSVDLIALDEQEFVQLFSKKIDKIKSYTDRKKFLSLCHNEVLQTVKMRLKNIPLNYIFGKKFFYGNEFFVSKDVLIPRFDSEVLVEESVKSFNNFLANLNIKNTKKIKEIKIIDICCGSGCLGISFVLEIIKILNKYQNLLSKHFKIKLFFLDFSKKALKIARKNADNLLKGVFNCKLKYFNLNILEYCQLKKADLLCENYFDYILYNPPYIKSSEIQFLSKEVQKEPKLALDGGSDGLDFYRILPELLKLRIQDECMRFFIEIGYDQKKYIEEIIIQYKIYNFYFIKDLGGWDRVLVL